MGSILGWLVIIFGVIVGAIIVAMLSAVDFMCRLLRGDGVLDEENWPYTDEEIENEQKRHSKET